MTCLLACGGGGDDRRVPYRARETPPAPEMPTTPAPEQPAQAPAFVPVASAPAPAGTTTLPLDGRPITFGGFTIIATLATDLDGDADRDALVMLSGATEVAIGLAKREPDRFVQTIVARDPIGTGCNVERAGARLLAPGIGAYEAIIVCGDRRSQLVWPLDTTAIAPRVVTRLAFDPPMPDTPVPASIIAVPEASDVNGDGTLDFALALTVTPQGGGSVPARLVWPNLPSGLALDRASLQPSITTLAREAKAKLARDPRRAAELALGALAIAASFCKEQGVPHVRVDGSRGMSCGHLANLSRSTAVRVAAFLRTNAPYDAHLTLATAHALGVRIAHDDAPIIGEALDGMTLVTATWQNVGEVGPANDAHAPYDALRFEAEDVIAVRATPPVRLRLPTTTPEPATDYRLPLIAPDGTYAVLDTQHTCQGDVVRLVSPDGRRVRAGHPRLATQPLPTPAPEPCAPDPSMRVHPSMYTVLGWGAQGLVVMLGARLFDLPVDTRGASHGLLQERTEPATLPEGLNGPTVTPDGRTLALNLEAGVLIRSPEGLRVLRGEAFAATRTTVPTASIAVAPSGRRVAVLRGKTLWVASF